LGALSDLFYDSIAAVLYTEENTTAVDVLRRRQELPCTPVVSCNESSSIVWERSEFGSDEFTNILDMISGDNTLTVLPKQYGRYRCSVNTGNAVGLLYNAYGELQLLFVSLRSVLCGMCCWAEMYCWTCGVEVYYNVCVTVCLMFCVGNRFSGMMETAEIANCCIEIMYNVGALSGRKIHYAIKLL